MPQVSIIVLTYNPDPTKLRATLTAAALQKGISTELIISDDGSAHKDFSFLPDLFQELNFSNWRIVDNQKNRGTVANCCAGLAAATGEYVFLTSPGDVLFDCTTMQQFYAFATEQSAQICFGNAVRYAIENNQVKRTSEYTIPADPELYNASSSLKKQKCAFFGDNFIIGASYFRSLEFARKYFSQLLDVSKFMEDTPSTMFGLIDGIKLHYYDKNIVFYEDGTGVSTGASNKWTAILHEDFARSVKKLHTQNPDDPYVSVAFINATESNRWKRVISRFLAHPVISLNMLKQKKLRTPKQIPCSKSDLDRLQTLLNKPTV